ncbi:MAG TPA: glycosyltransferase family 4 protein [Vicinamibacterales bacterium]|nr:glycosyltransferase family 4 protein [Vicinamibacterales bacterium]
MRVNQWIPAAHRGDAIGDSARRVRQFLRAMGHDSDIFALTIDEDMRGEALPFDHPHARAGELTIFHFAVPSPMTAAFAALPRGRVLQYHNVTPAHFFAPYHPEMFRIAALGRREVEGLAQATDLALGDSEFNRRELEQMGFRRTAVMPIAVDTARITGAPPHPELDRILGDGLTNFLFVGRIVPNKRIEDIIRLAEQFKRYIDAQYRFIFVGRTDGVPRYYAAIRSLILRYEMLPERFLFPGVVPDVELAAYYRWASVYLSMSEHEGFCVPLVEAMAADVPVFAYASTAVPETLGGAGVTFTDKDMEYVAELLGQLAFDPAFRARVIEGQRRRLRAFSDDAVRARLREVLQLAAAA